METNRQKKIGSVLQNDLVDILQGEVRKNGLTNLIISVSKEEFNQLSLFFRFAII